MARRPEEYREHSAREREDDAQPPGRSPAKWPRNINDRNSLFGHGRKRTKTCPEWLPCLCSEGSRR